MIETLGLRHGSHTARYERRLQERHGSLHTDMDDTSCIFSHEVEVLLWEAAVSP